MLISGLVGIVIFATLPVAPPRLVDLGLVDTVTEQSHAYRVLQPPSLVNQFAAMPSFHAGWDLLIGIGLVREGRRAWTRVIGVLLPIAMTLSVVVTAYQYLLDVIAGFAIVIGALALAIRLCQRHDCHQRLVLASSQAPPRSDRAPTPLAQDGRHDRPVGMPDEPGRAARPTSAAQPQRATAADWPKTPRRGQWLDYLD